MRVRLASYCRATSASTAPCTSRRICCLTHCASHCAPCQPLLRAFSGWIPSPPPSTPPVQQPSGLNQIDDCKFLISWVAEANSPLPDELENCSSQGHNLALTVLHVPTSLDRFSYDASNQTNLSRIKRFPGSHVDYRGTSLIRKRHPLGLYTRTMPRDIWWP